MPRYLISKYLDPVFALFIGVSAAGVRVRREEAALGRSAWETAVRRAGRYLGGAT